MINPLIASNSTTRVSFGHRFKTRDYKGNNIIAVRPNDIIKERAFTALIDLPAHRDRELFIRMPLYFTNSTRAVWDYLGIVMDTRNCAYVPLAAIEADLGCSSNTASLALKTLYEHDYIRPRQKSNFMLNPNVIARCRAKDRTKLVDVYSELKESDTMTTVKDLSEWYRFGRM